MAAVPDDVPYFEVLTPLGVVVRTTPTYWARIVTFKHPVMRGREEWVQRALRNPSEVRRSKKDQAVQLYYAPDPPYHVCVVVKCLAGRLHRDDLSHGADQGRRSAVAAALRVYYDADGKTLTVWFDDPNKEFVAEETGEEVVIIKDRANRVIGFERLNFVLESDQDFRIEAIAV